MTPDPHDLITEAHHQLSGMMALITDSGELQPMAGADLYFLLKAIDERLEGAMRLLERAVPAPS